MKHNVALINIDAKILDKPVVLRKMNRAYLWNSEFSIRDDIGIIYLISFFNIEKSVN